MDIGAKIKINKDSGEIEISGSEGFVDRHVSLIGSLFNLSETGVPVAAAPVAAAPVAATPVAATPVAATPVAATPVAAVPVAAVPVAAVPVAAVPVAAAPVATEEPSSTTAVAPVKRGRGRPRKNPEAVTESSPSSLVKASVGRPKAPKMANSFSGFLKSFTTKMKKGDLILAAGYYFQQSTKSDTFSTFNASKLLKAQGVQLANPSQYMKNNMSSKRVIMLDKRTYQVTSGGVAHLNMLMAKD